MSSLRNRRLSEFPQGKPDFSSHSSPPPAVPVIQYDPSSSYSPSLPTPTATASHGTTQHHGYFNIPSSGSSSALSALSHGIQNALPMSRPGTPKRQNTYTKASNRPGTAESLTTTNGGGSTSSNGRGGLSQPQQQLQHFQNQHQQYQNQRQDQQGIQAQQEQLRLRAIANAGKKGRSGGFGNGSGAAGGLGDDGMDPLSRRRDARKSKVGEKIKKRLSMRYAEPLIPSMTDPSAPPLPALPSAHTQDRRLPRHLNHSTGLDHVPGTGANTPEDGRDAPPGLNLHPDASNLFGSYGFPAEGRGGTSGTESGLGGPGDIIRSSDAGVTGRSQPPLGFRTTGGVGGNVNEREVANGTTAQEEWVRPRGSVAPPEWRKEEEMRRRWDLEGLKGGEVDVGHFIKQTLAGADAEEIAAFKAALQERKEENSEELKQNVFRNYAEFVVISKEITTLENDMGELKELLSEWKATPALLESELGETGDTTRGGGGVTSTLERRKTVRNSVLDLQNLYRTQLQSLWTQIGGSQKFLPLAPGRHLVCRASDFVELNSATYKVKQTVELFLLNDLLLVAGKRRKKTSDQARGRNGDDPDGSKDAGRLVAERCWNLTEIVVVDVKDSGDLTNAIKVRRGKESFVYRTHRPDDKRALLAAFRQVAEELALKKRKENEREQERRKSLWTTDMFGSLAAGAPPPLPGSSGPDRSRAGMAALARADGGVAESQTALIDSFEDDLAMQIAIRSWDEAVESVLRGRTYLNSSIAKALPNAAVTARLAALSRELIAQLAYDLSNANLKKTAMAKLAAFLIRLDESTLARNTFLAARKTLLQQRIRMITYQGDIPLYINELGLVTFTIMKHTAEWYLLAFKENRMASALVDWAKHEIETFAATFRRQVYGPARDSQMVDDCLRIIAQHNRKLLRDAGLDFTFLLSKILQEHPEDPDIQPHTIFKDFPPRLRRGDTQLSQGTAGDRQESMLTGASPAMSSTAGFSPDTLASQQNFDSNAAHGSPKPPPRSERRARAPPSAAGNQNRF